MQAYCCSVQEYYLSYIWKNVCSVFGNLLLRFSFSFNCPLCFARSCTPFCLPLFLCVMVSLRLKGRAVPLTVPLGLLWFTSMEPVQSTVPRKNRPVGIRKTLCKELWECAVVRRSCENAQSGAKSFSCTQLYIKYFAVTEPFCIYNILTCLFCFFLGSYFARDAQYSHRYCQPDAKVKRMFVARVLVGDFVVGNVSYNRPPARSSDMTNCYDSCVDKMVDPSIFVIFEKHQIYPAYLISYIEENKCVLA